MLWYWVTGWERYKKALCQKIGISWFILGTCFHSYINVVEVGRSGIPVSDPLHELCLLFYWFSSHTEKKNTIANCLGDIVQVMKGRNVSEMCRGERISLSRSLGRFRDAMCHSTAGQVTLSALLQGSWQTAQQQLRLKTNCCLSQSIIAMLLATC